MARAAELLGKAAETIRRFAGKHLPPSADQTAEAIRITSYLSDTSVKLTSSEPPSLKNAPGLATDAEVIATPKRGSLSASFHSFNNTKNRSSPQGIILC